MAKVLLVEDDNNLREIFEMRLQAEGYNTLSASDGEEALVIATKEKPDLIIADVMMPKLSGFEMLETLRAAPEMSQVKVVMMTALGQAEDRARGEKLGVVKYLVKSQVTLEDFVNVVREVLPPEGGTPSTAPANQGSNTINSKQESEQSMQNDNTNPNPPAGMPPADDSAGANPVSGGDAPATPPADASGDQMSAAQEQNVVNDQVKDFASGASADQPPAAPAGDSPAFPSAEPPAAPADGSPQPPVDEPKPEDTPPAAPPAGM